MLQEACVIVEKQNKIINVIFLEKEKLSSTIIGLEEKEVTLLKSNFDNIFKIYAYVEQ